MKKMFLPAFLALFVSLISQPAAATLRIFACEPEWGALAKEIGGDQVSVYTATQAGQDPHHVQARPSMIARMRRADMVIATGAQLEIGWLPVLIRQAANARVQRGQPGYLAASDYVQKLGVPARVDRAMGDVHAAGNPHIQTDPRNIARVAAVLAKRLGQIDPAHAAFYQSRYQEFSRRWQDAIARWEKEAAPLKGTRIVVYHKGWNYLNRWLGLIQVGALEPVPGVPPSTSHLAQLLSKVKQQQVAMVIYAAYQNPRPSEWLAQRAGIPAVKLPFSVGGTDSAGDLFALYDDTIHRLLKAVGKSAGSPDREE